MRKLVILIITIIISLSTYAQLEVKEGSFKEVKGFVNINTDIMYDENDKPYAVIKVKTENISDKQRRELLFEGDARTFVEHEYKVGEVWLYISYYATYLKISHPDFSSTEFTLPFDMEPKKGYEMTLINMYNYTPVPEKTSFNYLIVKADQPDAMIYIDDVFVGYEQVSKQFKVGEKHKWRIECKLYYTESGEATIMLDEKVKIDKILRPAFGYLNVTSLPESGATVFIDSDRVGVTPYKSDKIPSGEHTVKVMKEMYFAAEEAFTVTDGFITEAKMTMSPNFVAVSVTTDSQSDIYVDNEKKGKGSWNGRLSDGSHVFEAKKASHRTSTKVVSLMLGGNESIVIPNPEPIYGTLDINSDPMEAIIYIDEKKKGETPMIIKDILIGRHELKLEKNGYISFKKPFDIDENHVLSMNEKLTVDPKAAPPKPKVKKEKAKVVKQKVELKKFSFITLNVALDSYTKPSFGLTVGSVKKYGWYVNAMSNFNFKGISADHECGDDFTVDGDYPVYTGVESYSSVSATAGFVYRISEPIALRVGVGYGMKSLCYEMVDGKNVKNTAISVSGINASAGAVLKLNSFVLSLDCVSTNFKCYEANLGFGIKF